MPKELTVKEVAKLKRRTSWTVYRWIREQYIIPKRGPFGRLLIPRAELKKLPTSPASERHTR